MEDVYHREAIVLLRESGNMVDLLIKRKVYVRSPHKRQEKTVQINKLSKEQGMCYVLLLRYAHVLNNIEILVLFKLQIRFILQLSSMFYYIADLGLEVGCKLYVKGVKHGSASAINGELEEGDFIVKVRL